MWLFRGSGNRERKRLEGAVTDALGRGDTEAAKETLVLLRNKFGSSTSDDDVATRLVALRHECCGEMDAAKDVYSALLAKNPANTAAKKRLIAVSKANRNNAQAIHHLNQYLSVCMSDSEAWLELADLYLEERLYSQAVFCYQEVQLALPYCHPLWTICGEILFTQGEFLMARKYFCKACELTDCQNLRSLIGVCMCCVSLGNQTGSDSLSTGKKHKHSSTTTTTSTSTSTGGPSEETINNQTYTWAKNQSLQLITHHSNPSITSLFQSCFNQLRP
ncbi:ER membrane protein complex subunit 2 [Pelomyxa schiedti]|nr:ER membrane protein complex subunit 2 [Pelomyxa schiedti]